MLYAIEKTGVPVTLVGDGELRSEIEIWIKKHQNLDIELTGWLKPQEVFRRLSGASFVIVPSEFYESFGNVIAELFLCGVPVVTTNIGAQAELVDNGRTGFLIFAWRLP